MTDDYQNRVEAPRLGIEDGPGWNRVAILEAGASLTTGSRERDYGTFAQNMENIADAWSWYLSGVTDKPIKVTGKDVCLMMALLKVSRTFNTAPLLDTYIDGAVYFAGAGECSV